MASDNQTNPPKYQRANDANGAMMYPNDQDEAESLPLLSHLYY
jgi:hypothetical protein